MKKVVVAAAFVVMCSNTAYAGMIERACLNSNRPAASKALCGCIQTVADKTLNSNDQRLAATFFQNPHMAQEVRQSDNRGHEAFWQKYKTFGAIAQSHCG